MTVKRFTVQNFFYISSAYELARLASLGVDKKPLSENRRMACVLGAITASVAFLECSINGLYQHAASGIGRQTKYRRLLASVYHDKLKFDNVPYLTKYQVALALAHKPMFELGADPYQSADLLNQLRNALIHPKEILVGLENWMAHSGVKAEKSRLEQKLTGKFKFNSSQDEESEFIPHRCLSPECALWAVETATDFFIDFELRIPATAYWTQPGKERTTMLKRVRELRLKEKRPSALAAFLSQAGVTSE